MADSLIGLAFGLVVGVLVIWRAMVRRRYVRGRGVK